MQTRKSIDGYLERYFEIIHKFQSNNEETIPFCAAEPIVSRLSKLPMQSDLSERYIKSGIRNFNFQHEFIGSEFIYPIYRLVSELCETLFGASYADSRPLSGMNASLAVLMSLTKTGDRILLQMPETGGHASFPAICERLGLIIEEIPFDYAKLSFNISKINDLLETEKYRAIFFNPSDLIAPPPINKLNKNTKTMVLYDCTQSFGLIASKHHRNPLEDHPNTVLLGATHKTIPGPTTGLVLCNNKNISEILEKSITPIYVRNSHPHHIASLALTLIEFLDQGHQYMTDVLTNANHLAVTLRHESFNVRVSTDNPHRIFTQTHQIFIEMGTEEAQHIHDMARRLNISLDLKDKKIYQPAGLRLGVQAATRIGWKQKQFEQFALLLKNIRDNEPFSNLEKLANSLRGKNECLYTLDFSAHESLSL